MPYHGCLPFKYFIITLRSWLLSQFWCQLSRFHCGIITVLLYDYHSTITGLFQLYGRVITALSQVYHSSITGLSQLFHRVVIFVRFYHRLLIVYHSACASTVMLLSTIIKIFMYFSLTTHDIYKGHQLCWISLTMNQ